METSGRIERIIGSIEELPTLPAVVNKVLAIIKTPDSSADDAAKIIEKDPALTSKMLRLANSAFYGIPRTISSVSSAVVVLGFNAIASLVLSVSVIKLFPAMGARTLFDHSRFWKHSVVTGLAARVITRHFFNIRLLDPESAFCAGILHDVGKLIFEHYLQAEYQKVLNQARQGRQSVTEAERELLGMTHAQVGSVLADRWRLPLELESALVHHHTPLAADKNLAMAATIHCADQIAHAKKYDLFDNENTPSFVNEARAILKMSDADYQAIGDQVDYEITRADDFFSIIGS